MDNDTNIPTTPAEGTLPVEEQATQVEQSVPAEPVVAESSSPEDSAPAEAAPTAA